MGKRGLGIEIGATAIRIIAGQRKGDVFQVDQVARIALPTGAADDPAAVKEALAQATKPKLRAQKSLAGLTGRDLMIRYSQVPPVPDWQLRQMMGFEINEIRSRSNEPVATDFNLLPSVSELTNDDTVLLSVAKESLLSGIDDSLGELKLKPGGYVPNSVAIYNAFAKLGPSSDGVTLLLNLGARNSDVAILRGSDLIFARNISTGSDVFNDAIMSQFNVRYEKAEKLKVEMANAAPREERKGLSPQEEKVAFAIEGAAGQIFSLIQSTLMFCKTQVKLQDISVDRSFITGGGARLKGLDRYLAAQFSVPVEVFDPLSEVAENGASDSATEVGPEGTAALGLAVMACTPDVYSLEILPESVRKRRDFARRYGFSIAALALILAFLGLDFFVSQKNYTATQEELKKIGSDLASRKSAKTKWDKELATREELAAKISLISDRQEDTVGLARAQAIVQKHLPEELWVKRILLDVAAPPAPGAGAQAPADPKDPGKDKDKDKDAKETGKKDPSSEKRTVVVVEGSGKESAKENLRAIYSRFEEGVRGEPDVAWVLSQPTTSGTFAFKLT